MPTRLRVLILEDRASDADLMLYELHRAEFDPEWQRVETEQDYLAAIGTAPDIILADFRLPQLDALGALRLLQERGLDIPLIVVTGTLGDEVAVECLKRGAADYLLKDRLVRLGPAVQRALEEKRLRAERERAVAALRASEERFRALVENMDEVVYRVKLDDGDPLAGPVEFVNGAVRSITGHDPTEFLEDQGLWFKLVHPDDRPAVDEITLGLLAKAEPGTRVYRVQHEATGTYRWVEDRVVPILDDSGKVSASQGVARDITEHRQAEEALRETEEWYQRIFHGANDAMFVYNVHDDDTRATFIQVNDIACQKLGYARADFLRLSVANIVAPETLQSPTTANPELLANKRFIGERLLITKDGARVPVEISARLFDSGAQREVPVVARDITDRKLAAAALADAEEKYRTLVESSQDAIVVTQQGRPVFINPATERLFGYRLDDVRTHSFLDFVAPEDRERIQAFYVGRLRGEAVPEQYEVAVLDHEGARVAAEIRASLIRYDGRPATMVVIRDISERKRAEEALRGSWEKLQRVLEETIQAVALTLEMRDPYTAGHQRRVAQLAAAIAAELGLPPDQIDGIRIAGVLHDTGKIAVPAEILSKPGALSEHEFNIVKTHPQVGFDILKNIEFPWPVARALQQHHERLDGSGYPLGYVGEAILPEARILAVADVVEAMASHRPYRPALGIEAALEEIACNQGTLYDPSAVGACLRLFREQGFEFEH